MSAHKPARLESDRPAYEVGKEARGSLIVFDQEATYFDHFEQDHAHDDHADDVDVDLEHTDKQSKEKWKKKKHHFKGIKWPKKLPHRHHKQHAERKAVLLEAQEVGESEQGKINANRHIIVLYNPISGAGVAKKLVDNMVEPVLRLSGCKYTIQATEYRGYAIEYMLKLDPESCDGVLIVGGDGLVHEVVTGYFRRPDIEKIDVTLGLVPCGTANAMAHELHAHDSTTHVALVGRAALAATRNHKRGIDVIQTRFGDKPEENIYALSVFGWGLAGTVAKAADDMRWIPGQKSFRYDLAGFVSMLKDWPLQCKATLEYPTDSGIKTEEISLINFTATNLPWLGVDHPMTQDSAPDDGYLVVSWVPTGMSRAKIVKMGLQMKSGQFLMEHKHVNTIKVPSFKLSVHEDQKVDIDMLIDGDPYHPRDVEVKVLHKGLTLFAEPKDIAGPLMVKRNTSAKVLKHVPLSPSRDREFDLTSGSPNVQKSTRKDGRGSIRKVTLL